MEAGLLAAFERLNSSGLNKMKGEKWIEAMKHFSEAASVVHSSEGDADPAWLGYFVDS